MNKRLTNILLVCFAVALILLAADFQTASAQEGECPPGFQVDPQLGCVPIVEAPPAPTPCKDSSPLVTL